MGAVARTGIKGLGRESTDLKAGTVFAALTVAIDGFLLSRIWRWAGEQTPEEHHAAVVQTLWLLGAVGFTVLLGVAVAGDRSTPQRRWRCAMLSPLLCQLLVPAALIVYFLIDPPEIRVPW
ncbi:hypothetical protein ACFU7Y_32820 [Kitasatospora sp. NPDC057542]|uniref:hypothetical protein n=1 Tax=Streptomycetaceae TaxID=2062 RepID=UPI001CC9C13C|nr:hypothetical protein [Streptomyces sp. LS1784]